jgi:hypothetical protein
VAEIGKVLGLKCPNCGASLQEGSELQNCKYCGMTVRIDDANKYLEYLKGFIISWMRTTLPIGVGGAASSSVDTLARHNIFIYNILPRINAEFGSIQTNAYDLFSKPLVFPPYVRYPYFINQFGETKSFFTYDAKITAIQPFAVNIEDQKNVQKMGGTALALAHVLIGLDLIKQKQPAPFKLTAENFSVASKALESQDQVLSKRLFALKELYLAMDELYSKNLVSARGRVDQAKNILEDVKRQTAFDINLSLCTGAIEEEIETANTINRIIDIMENSWDGNQLGVLAKINKFFETLSTSNNSIPITWKNRLESAARYCELSKWLSGILESKRGRTAFKITRGSGRLLFPFWVTQVRYTFGTGALWMKKGRCVEENALVAATFPLVPGFASAPSEVVTDIFSSKPIGSITSSIVGSETSISIGAQVSNIVQNAQVSSLSGCQVLPPLSTMLEAKQIIGEYVQQVSRMLVGKMQIASCDVTELLFVPANLSTGHIDFNGSLGYLQPRKVGDPSLINGLLV